MWRRHRRRRARRPPSPELIQEHHRDHEPVIASRAEQAVDTQHDGPHDAVSGAKHPHKTVSSAESVGNNACADGAVPLSLLWVQVFQLALAFDKMKSCRHKRGGCEFSHVGASFQLARPRHDEILSPQDIPPEKPMA